GGYRRRVNLDDRFRHDFETAMWPAHADRVRAITAEGFIFHRRSWLVDAELEGNAALAVAIPRPHPQLVLRVVGRLRVFEARRMYDPVGHPGGLNQAPYTRRKSNWRCSNIPARS